MTAIGLCLIIVGIILYSVLEPDKYSIDHWRNSASAYPIILGGLLMLSGLIVWMWNNLP